MDWVAFPILNRVRNPIYCFLSHRIGLSESPTLKVREYCARGIPWIIACKDPDFPDDFPYILRVPPDESPIDIDPVIDFAQKICSDPDHPKK